MKRRTLFTLLVLFIICVSLSMLLACGEQEHQHNADDFGFCSVCEKPMKPTEGVLYRISNDCTYAEVVDCNENLKKVKIADEYLGLPVTHITEESFKDCIFLEKVIISDSITFIDDYAFYSCKVLKSVELGKGITYFGEKIFYDCDSLESIIVSELNPRYHSKNNCIIETLTNDLIMGCKKSIIPQYVTSIEDYSFYGCKLLESITIPVGVTSIGKSSFTGCYSLTNIYLPNSIQWLGDYAFSGCNSLTSVTFEKNSKIEKVGNGVFYACESLKEFVMPSSVTSIGNEAFKFCTSLASIDISNNVKTIGESSFAYCYSLTNVIIPGNVVSISKSSFEFCTKLVSVKIPNNVISIGNDAFYGCYMLEKIYCERDTKASGWSDFWNRKGEDTNYLDCFYYHQVVWGYKG